MTFELLSFNDSAECQADIKSLNPEGTGAKSRRVACPSQVQTQSQRHGYGNSGPDVGRERRISANSSPKRINDTVPVFLRQKLMTRSRQSMSSATR